MERERERVYKCVPRTWRKRRVESMRVRLHLSKAAMVVVREKRERLEENWVALLLQSPMY